MGKSGRPGSESSFGQLVWAGNSGTPTLAKNFEGPVLARKFAGELAAVALVVGSSETVEQELETGTTEWEPIEVVAKRFLAYPRRKSPLLKMRKIL